MHDPRTSVEDSSDIRTLAEGAASTNQPSPADEKPRCENCRAELLGPFCAQCGQATRSPIREFFSVISDGTLEALRPNGKLFQTLKILYFQPGGLTNRYLAGQRVSFVKPFRLYLAFSLLLFFLLSLDLGFRPKLAAEITYRDDNIRISLNDAMQVDPQGHRPPFDFQIEGKAWHYQDNPVRVESWPDFLNRGLNQKMHRINSNAKNAENPNLVMNQLLNGFPTVMFLLMPLFALLLHGFYWFKKRLYAEHLLIAVQAHSFMFLSFIILTLISMPLAIWPESAFVWKPMMAIIGGWIPVYLLLAQKRVYQQGWIMTCIKFGAISFIYALMLLFALAIAIISAFANS